MALEPGTRFGSYEVAESIGSGGMGVVYRAKDTQLKRDVALKVLPVAFAEDRDRLARFQREAEILASLNHPNIAQVYGLETTDGQTVIVMELVEGPTLADRLERGVIPLAEALEIATQIADALEAAHERGVVHRDLKPANIKLRPDGTIKVLDFGVAKAVDAADAISGDQPQPLATPAMTGMGIILGTAGYMSPEQARGKPVDRRADIWSFGCVLYEMLTGQPAFAGEDVTVTLARVLERESDFGHLPAETPAAVRRTLSLCLQKDARKRIRDIGDVKLALQGAFDSGFGTADAADSADFVRVRRQTRLWMIATVVSLLIAVSAYFYLADDPVPAPASQRLVLDFPREGADEGLYFQYRLSPDGRYVAVSGVIGETAGIYVRALDSLQWRRVTELLSDVFWSPDSLSLYFATGGQLLRVPVDGGPVERIAEVEVSFGGGSGTINQNGVMVVSPGTTGGLQRLSDDGREISQLTTTEPFEGHRYPFFLPDGDHYFYTARGGSREGIFLASLDDPAGRRLLADPSSAIYAPPESGDAAGYLIFERDGQLMAQRFDAAALELVGQAAVIVDKVVPQDNGAAAVSVSNTGLMLYRGGRHQSTDSRLISVSREGQILAPLTAHAGGTRISVSPDERRIALVRGRQGLAVGDVSVVDLERGLENSLTFDGRVPTLSNAVWAPDGQRLAYTLVDNDNVQYQIVIDDPDGPSNPTALLTGSSPLVVTDWTEDGVLVYTEYNDITSNIYYLRLDEDNRPAGDPIAFRADRFQTSFGDVSPDGRWIAYASNESGIEEIWLESFPTGSRRWRLTDTRARAQQPRWNRDGTELYFESGAGGNQTMMLLRVDMAMIDDGTAFSEAEPLFRHGINGFHPRFGALLFDEVDNGERFIVDAVDMSLDSPSLNVITYWQRLFSGDQ